MDHYPHSSVANRSGTVVQALARAFSWAQIIETGQVQSISELARNLEVDGSYVTRILKLTTLAPVIVEAIINGEETDGAFAGQIDPVLSGRLEFTAQHVRIGGTNDVVFTSIDGNRGIRFVLKIVGRTSRLIEADIFTVLFLPKYGFMYDSRSFGAFFGLGTKKGRRFGIVQGFIMLSNMVQ